MPPTRRRWFCCPTREGNSPGKDPTRPNLFRTTSKKRLRGGCSSTAKPRVTAREHCPALKDFIGRSTLRAARWASWVYCPATVRDRWTSSRYNCSKRWPDSRRWRSSVPNSARKPSRLASKSKPSSCSSLLSAVSHDLRTPLSVITGASSTLLDQDQSLDPKTRQALTSSILDESERLNRLVANLLDMTQLQAGALQVRRDWNVVEDVVGTALARMRRQLHDRPVTTHLAADLPLVPLDDLLIQQVLINLLENAVRYTPPSSEIEVAAQMDGTALVVEVADRGPGLPAGDSRRLFAKFYRGARETSSAGAGLGLAICRGIVELHGGRIEAANRPEAGAVFRFWLPVVGQPPGQTIPEPIENVAAATARGS